MMFQVNDRVKKRSYFGDGDARTKDPNPNGTIIEINGRWITVQHDEGSKWGGAVGAVPPRFDYLAEDLEHINPLLKLVRAIS